FSSPAARALWRVPARVGGSAAQAGRHALERRAPSRQRPSARAVPRAPTGHRTPTGSPHRAPPVRSRGPRPPPRRRLLPPRRRPPFLRRRRGGRPTPTPCALRHVPHPRQPRVRLSCRAPRKELFCGAPDVLRERVRLTILGGCGIVRRHFDMYYRFAGFGQEGCPVKPVPFVSNTVLSCWGCVHTPQRRGRKTGSGGRPPRWPRPAPVGSDGAFVRQR